MSRVDITSQDEYYLSVRVDTLINLFNKQGSLRDQKKLSVEPVLALECAGV
jgi:hypothetical protein